MRVPTDLPPRRQRGSNRRRIALVVALVLAFLLATSLRGIAGFWTDYLWFDSLGLGEIFTGVLGAQVTLVLLFTFAFFVLLFVNLTIADRIAPKFRPAGPEELLLARYQDVMGRRAGLVRASVALLLGLLFGASAGSEWNTWILFSHRQSFGQTDAQFGRDIGFYVFELPFYSFVVEWLFVTLVIVLCIVAAAHYLNGGIRMQSPFQRVTPQVKAHLSVLLALAALVKAADYWLQRFGLLFSDRGFIDGAGYTDLEAQLPALDLLLLISLAACLLFIVNIWRRGWVLPSVAVGLWVFAALIAGTAYPAIIQRFVVQPEESAKEQPYIDRNIRATRTALALDDVTETPFDYDGTGTLTAADLRTYEETVRNLRILDPRVVEPTFDRQQAKTGFYRFEGLDVDRYPVGENGDMTQVIVSARELNLDGVKAESWELQHAGYTHGYGMVLAPSSRTVDGFPEYLVRGLPVEYSEPPPLLLPDPQIYVGEGMSGYAVVGTDREEIDYVNEQNDEVRGRPYEGTGGVNMSGSGIGGFFRRAAFALRFGEVDPLISNFVTDESRVIYVRDVRERVEKVAPFFQFDANPYPVVIDGRINYVLDGYATTDLYPYAERVDTGQLSSNSGLDGHSFNYIRNSVKAVVDAYDGTVTLYVMDESDPITRAYREAFPDLFAGRDEIPEELKQHLRYPDDLFIVQTTMWGRYHISDPAIFYTESENWEVAQDPGTTVSSAASSSSRQNTPTSAGTGVPAPSREEKIPPYYLQMQLPGESEASFVSVRPFVRSSRGDENKLLPAFMVADSAFGSYGHLTVYEIDQPVNSPAIVAAAMSTDPRVSETLTDINQQGSSALFGNMTVVPIGDELLYVRPLYTAATGETSVPLLRYVILSFGEDVFFDTTLPGALGQLFEEDGRVTNQAGIDAIEAIFDQSLPTPDGEGEEPVDEPTAPELLAQAQGLFEDAQEILDNMEDLDDLGDYQAKVEEAQQLVERALTLLEGEGGAATGSDGDAGGDTTTTTESPPTTDSPSTTESPPTTD